MGYEELIWVRISGGWVSHVVEVPMNMNVYVVNILVCSIAIKSAYNYALRLLWHPSRRGAILICSGPLNTLAPTIFFFPSPSGGVNDPSV